MAKVSECLRKYLKIFSAIELGNIHYVLLTIGTSWLTGEHIVTLHNRSQGETCMEHVWAIDVPNIWAIDIWKSVPEM